MIILQLKKSLDGQNWGELITIKGSGDSYHSNLYNYRDYNQVEGIVYYRLFQKDYNGSIDYLGLVVLYTEPKDDIKLIKVVNFMGQEINPDIYNGPKLYIYENGMVVKKH